MRLDEHVTNAKVNTVEATKNLEQANKYSKSSGRCGKIMLALIIVTVIAVIFIILGVTGKL
jgi:t-SNARE complex subunit (syntaxin)